MSFTDEDSSKSGQQSFSDADLKRLKEKLSSGPGEVVMLTVSAYELANILARLEAAEKVATEAEHHECFYPGVPKSEICYLCGPLEDWRKAAGKQ